MTNIYVFMFYLFPFGDLPNPLSAGLWRSPPYLTARRIICYNFCVSDDGWKSAHKIRLSDRRRRPMRYRFCPGGCWLLSNFLFFFCADRIVIHIFIGSKKRRFVPAFWLSLRLLSKNADHQLFFIASATQLWCIASTFPFSWALLL